MDLLHRGFTKSVCERTNESELHDLVWFGLRDGPEISGDILGFFLVICEVLSGRIARANAGKIMRMEAAQCQLD